MPKTLESKWRSLNRNNQKQAADFIDFLLSRQQMEHNQRSPQKGKIRLGIWKNEPYYIADDFDASLDDFKEYM